MDDYTDPQIMEAVNALRTFLRKKNKGDIGQIRGGDQLYDKISFALMKSQGFNTFLISKAFKWLKDHSEIKAKKWNSDPFYPATGMVRLNLKPLPLRAYEREWQAAVSESSFSLPEKEYLQQAAIASKLSDLARNDMDTLLKQLYKFRANPAPAGQHLYDVSAKHFNASSKLLDYIGSNVLTRIGIDISIYLSAPKYIAIAGNPNPKSVILVENPHSFEAAVRADKELRHTWISSYGFGLSLDKSKEYGHMLVKNLKNHRKSLIPLIRKGAPIRQGDPDPLGTLLRHKELQFWGDLDQAGMQIFSDLKKNFPQIQLSSLYRPMLEHIQNGIAHPYSKSTGKENQKYSTSDKPLVYEILSRCRERAVDQEILTEEQICKYVGVGPLKDANV